MTLQWSGDFETGIEEIDFHHESIVEKLNELLLPLSLGRRYRPLGGGLFCSRVSSHPILSSKKFYKKVCLSGLSISLCTACTTFKRFL